MVTKTKKNEVYDWDHFGSDDRGTAIGHVTVPKKNAKKPASKPTGKKK